MMSWEQEIMDHAISCVPEESCGLLGKINNKIIFFKCNNKSKDKNKNFLISIDDWIRIEDESEIIGIVHSHPTGSAELSKNDRKNCIELDYPYYVVSVENKNYKVFYPKELKKC